MFVFKILAYPINKMIFEHSFNELVENIWGYQFVDVCTGKMLGERLTGWVRDIVTQSRAGLTMTFSMIPYVSQSVFESNASLHAFVCSDVRGRGSGWSRFFAGEVQLDTIVIECKELLRRSIYSPCTPSTNDSCE